MTIKTCDDHWDCECTKNYIHKKKEELTCAICGAREEEMPDSREKEINELVERLKELDEEFERN